ncbi:MAG: BamA/TamA family outer membrane protein [Deinococcales bacterium]|nr:BamA/TamA family outer membrane protein [Chitinophagaceae bacterium]
MKSLKNVLLTIIILLPLITISQIDTIRLGKKKQTIIFPVIARSIETSWSFGVAASSTFRLNKIDSFTRTSNIQALALYSLKNQFVAAIEGAQYAKNESYIFNELLSYSSFPDKFWGIGNHTLNTAEEPYNFNQYYINLHFLKNMGHKFFIGTLLEVQNLLQIDYKKGGLFDLQNISGRKSYLIVGLGVSLTYDNRSNAFAPEKGMFAQIYFNHFDTYLGSDYVYSNLVVDARKYLPFKKNVLALQAYYTGNFADEIPIRSMASLGGSSRMRGYYEGRYRDKQLMVLQSEARLPVYKRFGAVVFGGLGDVGKTIGDFSLSDIKYSYGAGVRFAVNKTERLNIRIDYGFGGNGSSGLYFQLGEAF